MDGLWLEQDTRGLNLVATSVCFAISEQRIQQSVVALMNPFEFQSSCVRFS
ncbi:hypothetical protein SAMN06265370_105215 [Puniceibacterium sediminis]|uniref:Uncharacterized protein n=1 Tax=Puniceibacterium sediminis TaxID=1608407 RepID=A0A238WH36_9RHOB|nr:hypothetical protein SAMN06265370_105215 [Puniceibacterium sediminis]